MTDAQYALLGALFGGTGLKVLGDLVGKWIKRGHEAFDEQVVLRKELRDEVQALREEISELRDQVDQWKQRYYTLLQEYVELTSLYKSMEMELHKLRNDADGINSI